jgi:uncharacterized membrane protein HdeD (DUF308 family)
MLAALAVNWAFLALRAAMAMVFGAVVLVWPGLRSPQLVWIFSVYVLADGALALIVALDVKGVSGFGALLLESLVRIGVGLFVFASPAFAALAVVDVVAAWAFLSGIAALAVAFVLRRDLTGEWPLPLAGTASVLFGLLLLAGPGAPSEIEWVAGPSAMLFGLTLLALAMRLRQLAQEMAATLG